MKQIQFKNKMLEYMWQVFLTLYCISVFVSKSGVSIFGAVLILISIFILPWKELWQNQKGLVLFLSLYPLAILCNFFSLGGAASAAKVAYSWPWVLLALPATVVVTRKQDQKIAMVSSCVALIVACLNSYYLFFTDFGGHFEATTHVPSYWNVNRWGFYLVSAMVGLIGTIAYFDKQKNKKVTYGLLVIFCLSGVSLFLANKRGPCMAAIVGIGVISLLAPRVWKYLGVLAVLLILIVSLSDGFRQQLCSIVDVKKESSGKITSNNASNAGRLHIWQVNLEFYKEQPWFGTGFENTETYLRDFLNKKGPEYIQKYVFSEFSYRDQHSSYLTMWVQMGILFSIMFWGVFAFLVFTFIADWWQTRSFWSITILGLIAAHLFLFTVYTSIQSYEMTALFPFIAIRLKKANQFV